MNPFSSDRLTDEAHWDSTWSNLPIPQKLDPDFSFDRCLSRALREILADMKGRSILEIGCAPGRWLAFFSEELGLRPFGIDYSKEGIEITRKSFSVMGVDSSGLQCIDVAKADPKPMYDVVISLGLIEHFEQPDRMVEMHARWLKTKGILILGVPNFRGLHGFLQGMMDPSTLKKHNLKTMTPSYFTSLSGRFGLTAPQIRYLGSFEPALIAEPRRLGALPWVLRWLLKPTYALRRIRVFDHWNSPWLSAYLLAVFEKDRSS